MRRAYSEQIRFGCEEKCGRAFCLICSDVKCAGKVSDVLSACGDVFLCKNLGKLSRSRKRCEKKCGFAIIDFYFYIINSMKDKNLFPDLKSPHYSNNHVDRNTESEGDHIYCKTLSQCAAFTEVDVCLLEGVLYLLLEEAESDRCSFLRSYIARIFVALSKYKTISRRYAPMLATSFYNVQATFREIMLGNEDTRVSDVFPDRCSFAERCHLGRRLTLSDYKALVVAVKRTLEEMVCPMIREDALLENLLDTFKILYLTNEKIGVYSYEMFYLQQLCNRLDVNTEFRYHKRGQNSIFRYTFALPLLKKYGFISYENSGLIKDSLQETFFRALFEGEKVPYFFITVDRKSVYRDVVRLLKVTPNFELRKQLRVKFKGEDGQDQGGIKKEFFKIISEEIWNESGLFEYRNDVMWFKLNENNRQTEFEVIGKIIGIALYNDVMINLPLPTLFFKRLLNKDTDLTDLYEIDPILYRSLNMLKGYNESELRRLDQTFEISYGSSGEQMSKQLLNDGKSVHVTPGNVNKYVDLYARFMTSDSVEPYMKAMRRGFLSVIQPTSLEFLHAKELEKIIVGSKNVDLESLRGACLYKGGYDENSDVVLWFWDTLEKYDAEMKSKVLQFIVGSDRMPATGKTIRIVIMKNGCDGEHLPSAQTCFNTIMIPEYKSREKFEKKLRQAVEYTRGFYLI